MRRPSKSLRRPGGGARILPCIPSPAIMLQANVPVLIYEFDHLITERNIDKQTDLDSVVREVTSYKLDALGEEGLKEVKKGDIIQFQRRGFYICDAVEPVSAVFSGYVGTANTERNLRGHEANERSPHPHRLNSAVHCRTLQNK